MQLSLDADQHAIVEAFATFFTRESSPARVRAAEPSGFDESLWRSLIGVGGPGIAVAPELGGGGGSLLDAALVAEQHGRRLAPAPLVEASVALRMLAQCADVGRAHISRVLEGAEILTLALHPARVKVADLVPWGAVADLAIVLDGEALLLVQPTSRSPQLGLGAEALGDVSTADPLVVELARGAEARALVERALDEWRVLKAAALVGLAAEALALAVAYVGQRHQFGRPIGSFQALAHGLVDVATAVDGARLLAYEAAWALDAGDGPSGPSSTSHDRTLASMAFAFAADTAAKTTACALHCHGGYGFMAEYDVQLYHRRAKSWALVHDSVRGELAHLAQTLWGA
ncbi:MAG: acyl-CoA dehydrogenase family protein [Acidimicrobiales bacterium]